jgi:predicted Zn-dependent protease
MGEKASFNKALAQLLNGNASDAVSILNALGENVNATVIYLKSIAQMRSNNTAAALELLKSAVSKDPRLKSYAKDDVEFLKLRDDAGFKSIVQ